MIVVIIYATFMAGLHVSRRLEARTTLTLCFGLSLITAAGAAVMSLYIRDILKLAGRDITLTGRTAIWATLMTSVHKHWLLGYGFHAFWLGLRGESARVLVATHWIFGYAHNGMLEIVLQLGLAGLVVFLITFLHAIKDAFVCVRAGRSASVDWYIGILILAAFYNITEETVLWPNDLLSILYVAACCGLSVTARRIKAYSQSVALHEMAEITDSPSYDLSLA
jgi:O-antigen ligase